MSTLVSRKESYDNNLDLYETPRKITEMLLDKLELSKDIKILEPANGVGAISNVLKERGYYCDTSDLREGVDFLKTVGQENYDMIITNPPYKFAQEFVEKSFEHIKEGGQVIMLLRLSFLEGKGRYNFFKTKGLKKLLVSSGRITMFPFGQDIPKNKGTLAYAWYIWEKGYTDTPTLDWFNN